jgi:hypothetical protein
LLEKELFSLDEGRLQQEEDDYDKKCFSNDCGIHNYHARLPVLRVQLGAGNPGTAPRGYGLRNHRHRDNPKLIAQWDSLLRRHDVDLYLSGHDHDLQHLEFKGHPTSFVISGGGGAELVGWTTSPQARRPSGLRALGFTDLQISKKGMVVRHIGRDASVLYEFKRTVNNHGALVITQPKRLEPIS